MKIGTRRIAALTSLVLAAGLITACGESEAVSEAVATGGDGETVYPLVLDNCGRSVTVDAPPQRVVSLDQDSTEILLSLGLQDRIVGTASWTDPVRENLAEANASVPRLADNAPTYEVVLGTDPDFVTASFGRHYEQGGVADRSRFAESDIETYLAPTDCDNGLSVNGGNPRTSPLTMEALYRTIREMAEVFDVRERGENFVSELQGRLDAATSGRDKTGESIAFWFADTKSPYLAGRTGAPALLAEQVGAKNVYPDLQDDWEAVGWETVVDRDPSVLVLGDLLRNRFTGDKLADKIAFLESDPLTSTMYAVKNKRYISLHGAEMNPSIRMVDAIEKLVVGLNEIGPRS
ncbi:putative ABC transporter substrate-binding protein [Rhodococcus sp. AW25M09]|uniref:ABC transporter substrate-binding protein n=1 Tax=Rhodococcus sp. AW25M09 TaxID=1268303 RepID=UPI0002AC28D7|nr:ABC transporter substrate-binding protein [Rhodococcus sp. AW25M09]CCQ17446.1 putative ABC transporter substrate-binding protein [Rhodococcus sp. AW25M09]